MFTATFDNLRTLFRTILCEIVVSLRRRNYQGAVVSGSLNRCRLEFSFGEGGRNTPSLSFTLNPVPVWSE